VRIVVPRETSPGERRVALVPESCKKLIQAGYEIAVEAGAGDAAGFADQSYADVNVSLWPEPASLVAEGDIVLKVTAPSGIEVGRMKPGAIYIGSLMPLRHLDAVRALASRRVTAFATRWPISGATKACCSRPSS
jgi:NAD(P) transhydrogenase subunit alpha